MCKIGKTPRYFMPGAFVQFVRFAGKDTGGKILNERRFEGSLFSILPRLESFIQDAIITKRPIPISILREKDVYNYPYKALRELLMNALMHRDYQANTPTRLYQFDDHIEILNPGGLYGEARPENFPNVNDYRNSVLAEMMKTLNYVNMFNHGIREVKSHLAENGNPEPEFKVDYITAFAVEIPIAKDDEPQVNKEVGQELDQEFRQVSNQVKSLVLCLFGNSLPKSELLKLGKLTKSRETLEQKFLNPSIEAGFVMMLYPNKPHHPQQKYYLTEKGKQLYMQIKNKQ